MLHVARMGDALYAARISMGKRFQTLLLGRLGMSLEKMKLDFKKYVVRVRD
jgi:hypothetical protein